MQHYELHGSNLQSLIEKNDPLKLVLMTPLTICESICEHKTGWKRRSYTPASKLMDQLKVFVGMVIFLSRMATSPASTSVSNSALWYQHTVSPGRGNGPTLQFIPTVQGKLMEGKRAAVTVVLFCTVINPTLFPQVGTCCIVNMQWFSPAV